MRRRRGQTASALVARPAQHATAPLPVCGIRSDVRRRRVPPRPTLAASARFLRQLVARDDRRAEALEMSAAQGGRGTRRSKPSARGRITAIEPTRRGAGHASSRSRGRRVLLEDITKAGRDAAVRCHRMSSDSPAGSGTSARDGRSGVACSRPIEPPRPAGGEKRGRRAELVSVRIDDRAARSMREHRELADDASESGHAAVL